MHEESCFLTFTYDNEHLPENGNLNKKHFPKFIRALRKKTGLPLRYYMCGEYGDKNNRPHYHALLFGYDFPDKTLVNIRNKNRVYISPMLDKIWGRGSCEIGSATYQSAGYVARYIIKKQHTAQDDQLRYLIYDENGEYFGLREFEYTQMSLKPGIGESWFRKFYSDCFPHDYCVLPDGRQTPVPAYYRRLLEREDPVLNATLRANRVEKAKANPDNTPQRLESRHTIQIQKQSRMTRNLDT